jgi:hypothetical protein
MTAQTCAISARQAAAPARSSCHHRCMPIARIAGTLAALAFATGLVTADSWPGATITETFSANRDWFVRVTPGTSVGNTVGFAGSPKGAFATAEWFSRTSDGGYRIAARTTLANPVAPVQTFVTDHGYVVTLDNWHNLGYGAAVAAYRPDGTRVVALALADLYSKGEIAAFSRSVSSIGWRSASQQAYVRHDQRSVYVAGTNSGDELLVEPETGRWQVCQPRNGTQQCRTSNEPRAWGPFSPLANR